MPAAKNFLMNLSFLLSPLRLFSICWPAVMCAHAVVAVTGDGSDSGEGTAEPKATFTPQSLQSLIAGGQSLIAGDSARSGAVPSVRAEGYRGIWFTLGKKYAYGDKYSGGLGSYTANHQPMAAYAPQVGKTFFTWGGVIDEHEHQLAIMVSYYDHVRHEVPRPVVLYLDPAVDDPHDNASLHIDVEGYIWIFKSGRNTSRHGLLFRSAQPWSIDAFCFVGVQELTYPQVWQGENTQGMFLLFTKYGAGLSEKGPARNLYWKHSADGSRWSIDQPLAHFGGHYQTSGRRPADGQTTYATFFNYHPQSNVDARTNVYYAQTSDNGTSWTDAAGNRLPLPLTHPRNPPLVLDLEARGQYMYTCDLNFDAKGNPILLFLVSDVCLPGPGTRVWTVLHWNGGNWAEYRVTESSHNYDMGSLYVDGEVWSIIAPTTIGPQLYGTGGEIALWQSRDCGKTWQQVRRLTAASPRNHSYVRRPFPAGGDVQSNAFAAFWADGDADAFSRSQLYFCNADGTRVWQLPYTMTAATAQPEPLPSADK